MSFDELTALTAIQSFIDRAICPEDVFGKIDTTRRPEQERELKRQYHKLVKALHPDAHNGDKKALDLAGQLSGKLNEFRDEAVKRIAAGTYGQRLPMPGKEPIVIKGKYVVNRLFRAGDIADLHLASLESSTATKPLLLKVARQAADNDLLRAEADILKRAREQLISKKLSEPWANTIPHITDSFLLDDGGQRRRVNVMRKFTGFVDAEEVRRRLPSGVDGRTLAWMWKRLLILIEWIGKCGFVHGAILPPHVLFYPDNDGTGKDERKHAVRLVDWAYAVEYKKRTRLSAWVPAWKNFYAPEILAKKPLGPWTDLYMGAMTMFYLAGAEVGVDGRMSLNNKEVPANIVGALTRCIDRDPNARPENIGKYFEHFTELLKKEYGAPRWHNFNLPAA